jgi:hypothetical protein
MIALQIVAILLSTSIFWQVIAIIDAPVWADDENEHVTIQDYE